MTRAGGGEGGEWFDENRVSYSRRGERCIGFLGGNNIANDNERGNSEKMRLGWVPNGEWGKQCYGMVNKFIRALWGGKTLPKGGERDRKSDNNDR